MESISHKSRTHLLNIKQLVTSHLRWVWYSADLSQTSVICFARVRFHIFQTFFNAKCLLWGIILFIGFVHVWHHARSVICNISHSDTKKIFEWFFDIKLGQNKHFLEIFQKKFLRLWYAIYQTPGTVSPLLYHTIKGMFFRGRKFCQRKGKGSEAALAHAHTKIRWEPPLSHPLNLEQKKIIHLWSLG